MKEALAITVTALFLAPLCALEGMYLARPPGQRQRHIFGWSALGFTAYTVTGVFLGQWPACAVFLILAAICAWQWWNGRRKDRDRAGFLIGAKSRALRDALVRRVREAAKPRPVLRPVPGGAA